MNKNKLFAEIAGSLWGPRYQSEAARYLGVSVKSVMRYDNGVRQVPPKLLTKLRQLMLRRRDLLTRLIDAADVAVAES